MTGAAKAGGASDVDRAAQDRAAQDIAAQDIAAQVIAIEDVTVTFTLGKKTIQALDHVSLTIPAGETLSIVGPSGCGKSTLLNMVAGFLTPTAGRVSVGGKEVAGPGHDRAVVFQPDAVFPWLTVRRNLEYGPRMRRRYDEQARGRVDFYLEKLGLTGFQDEYPKVLSGGMRKRVDVGRAYVNTPSVMLLDEPFGALDEMTKTLLQEELVRLNSIEPMTTVFITHDIEEAIYVADRVAVMTARPGQIKQILDTRSGDRLDEAFRSSAQFQSMRRQVQQLLHDGVGGNAEAATA